MKKMEIVKYLVVLSVGIAAGVFMSQPAGQPSKLSPDTQRKLIVDGKPKIEESAFDKDEKVLMNGLVKLFSKDGFAVYHSPKNNGYAVFRDHKTLALLEVDEDGEYSFSHFEDGKIVLNTDYNQDDSVKVRSYYGAQKNGVLYIDRNGDGHWDIFSDTLKKKTYEMKNLAWIPRGGK